MRFLGGYKIALLTCSVIALSIFFAIYLIEFENGNSPTTRTGGKVSEKSLFDDDFMFMSIAEDIDRSYSLHYDYYRESCPSAEKIIAKSIRDIYDVRPSVAPSLIRLLFHDCFIEVRLSDFWLSVSCNFLILLCMIVWDLVSGVLVLWYLCFRYKFISLSGIMLF